MLFLRYARGQANIQTYRHADRSLSHLCQWRGNVESRAGEEPLLFGLRSVRVLGNVWLGSVIKQLK